MPNPLDNINNLTDFNTFLTDVTWFTYPGKGRKFMKDGRAYTMNQIVYKMKECMFDDRNPLELIKDVLVKIQTLDQRTNKALKEIKVTCCQRFMTTMRQKLGNLIFWMTHGRFRKTEYLKLMDQEYSKLEPQPSVQTTLPPIDPKLEPQTPVAPKQEPQTISPAKAQYLFDEKINEAYLKTPEFNQYAVTISKSGQRSILTSATLRPSNLFFQSLFKDSNPQITTTLPGEGLFKFNNSHQEVREFLDKKYQENPDASISIKATGIPGSLKVGKTEHACDLGDLYGNNEYKISMREIMDTLNSQRIYTSSLLPLPFYCTLKDAMKKDNIVELPGRDHEPYLLRDFLNDTKYSAISKCLNEVKQNPANFGFTSNAHFEQFLDYTIYQVGSMVVKSEDYRIFIDGNGKMIARPETGKNDAIRLINACGIRGIRATKGDNLQIMRETFKAALHAAEDGIVIFPAVGMGVWGGPPEIYWTAFLDAIVESEDKFVKIGVNPGHKPTPYGNYKDCVGNEFQSFLRKYLQKAHQDNNQAAVKKLMKIVDHYHTKKDVVQLAHNLKVTTGLTVSLFNASDPDVTLGYHVGEYTNNRPHIATTEENYTAMGTNGLCFEGITKIHENRSRLIQVK